MFPPRPCAPCPPACEPADGQPAPSLRMRSTPIAATTMTNTASKFARLGSGRSSPVAGEQHDSGLGVYRGSSSRVSPYCTGSAGSASDGKYATTSTKPSSASPAPSSAGDASATSQTVRSSESRCYAMGVPRGGFDPAYVLTVMPTARSPCQASTHRGLSLIWRGRCLCRYCDPRSQQLAACQTR